MMSQFLVGVDGGVTATKTLVADLEGHIRGASISFGCCCYQIGGVDQAREQINQSVTRALAAAQAESDQVAFGCFGLSGADWPEDHILLSNIITDLRLLPKHEVVNDTFIALRSGTTQPYGIGIVCGTGANAAAIDPQGQRWAFNSYSDWGGGLSLGKEALRAVLRSVDGRGQPTTLLRPVLDYLGYASTDDLLKDMWAGQLDGANLPGLSPLVFEAAEAGDEPARQLLIRLGKEMALYATALVRRFHMEASPVEVVLAGGLFKGKGNLFIDTLTEEIRRVAPAAQIVRPVFPPSVGALLLAFEADGRTVTPAVYTNLQRTVAETHWEESQAAAPQPDDGEGPFTFPLFF